MKQQRTLVGVLVYKNLVTFVHKIHYVTKGFYDIQGHVQRFNRLTQENLNSSQLIKIQLHDNFRLNFHRKYI